MKLHRFKIRGYKRLKDIDLLLGDATFLIGSNNAGKSSALKAIEYFLSGATTIPVDEYYSEKDEETGDNMQVAEDVVLEAEFRNVPAEAHQWRGFKGRIFEYDIPEGSSETGLCIFYKKTFNPRQKVVVEMMTKERSLKPEYDKCNTPQDYIDAGAPSAPFEDIFPNLDAKITKAQSDNLDMIDEIWDIGENEIWFQNPGGIQGNILARLPRFILIPAESVSDEIESSKGVLSTTLKEIFTDVREKSENYKEAQNLLNKLANELDPTDESSDFGVMMSDLNSILQGIFPDSSFLATANLSDPDKALTPSFDISMSSNIQTKARHQGTGMTRSAVFALLRYRQIWLEQRTGNSRTLIIGFEEPEIYLHPSAANQMRDTIYDLTDSSSQIVASTHSPFMIDLSRKPRQVLNKFSCEHKETNSMPFSTTSAFKDLTNNDKSHVKMILKIDDYVARAFFTKQVILVEGDTEDLIIKEALKLLPLEARLKIKADFEVIKARGKATIISLVKYLKALNVDVFVIHDRDINSSKAESFNEPILEAVGDASKVHMLAECIEDVLGYSAPSSDKPYNAYLVAKEWTNWSDVPTPFKAVLEKAFNGYIEES